MSDEINETADAIEIAVGAVERGVEAVASQIADLAATYGEPAWETVLFITRIDAAQRLLTGFILAAIVGAAIYHVIAPCSKAWLEAHRRTIEPRDHNAEMKRMDDTLFNGTVACAAGTICLLPFGFAAERLFSVWNWLALIHPELYLAKRALDAVVGL